MTTKWKLIGICCESPWDGEGEICPGIMQYQPDIIKEDGTVIHSSICNVCGYKIGLSIKPRRKSRRTSKMRCRKCDFIHSIKIIRKRTVTRWVIPFTCPKCGVMGYQQREWEEYGELIHGHGSYGNHPVSRVHRKVRRWNE